MPRGFTLIELLITVAIIATLASIAMPLSELAVQRAKEAELRKALRDIRDALDTYKRASDEGRIVRAADQSGFPPALQVLVEGVTDARSPSGAKIYFLRRIPRDPMTESPETPPASTWRLRSYASPPDKPVPGKDVFDVYSASTRMGLNGIPYREW
ncbi:MAG: type II secretion system GspH family protein [Betaproteobacteria bacterium]|nr:type II secretion system GspH family protein [Betaproteobacteria bacterium]MDH5222742.1 type II secretion system GspH family protein [Betaproteobacteria bacterium]MDH5352557.1 type II secretion system GspH family protein [Betaproteobacteria bacterium]